MIFHAVICSLVIASEAVSETPSSVLMDDFVLLSWKCVLTTTVSLQVAK